MSASEQDTVGGSANRTQPAERDAIASNRTIYNIAYSKNGLQLLRAQACLHRAVSRRSSEQSEERSGVAPRGRSGGRPALLRSCGATKGGQERILRIAQNDRKIIPFREKQAEGFFFGRLLFFAKEMPVLRDCEFKSRRTGISFASHLPENGKTGGD